MPVVQIPFTRWSYRNSAFVIVDETVEPLLFEQQKADFARPATESPDGIRADKLLIIQPCRAETLRAIHCVRQYWSELPDSKQAEFILRVYEPSGKETLACSNGLSCTVDYLQRQYGLETVSILCNIPLHEPRIVSFDNPVSEQQALVRPQLIAAGHLRASPRHPQALPLYHAAGPPRHAAYPAAVA